MSSLLRCIKEIIRDYLSNEALSDLLYGSCTEGGLLLDDQMTCIPWGMVDIPAGLRQVEGKISLSVSREDRTAEGLPVLDAQPELERLTLREAPVVLQYGLQPGDRVAVCRSHGGRHYAIVQRL